MKKWMGRAFACLKALGKLEGAKLWVCEGQFVLTDPPHARRPDAVFPLCKENRYFVRHLEVAQGSRALDLCTGSGIIALACARKAREVVAVDINPRAIEFARLNAALNGMVEKVDVRLGNLFDPVRGEKFDLITANPPFEPVPSGLQYYIHSDGGESGAETVEAIFDDVASYLKPGGVFQMVAFFTSSSIALFKGLRRQFDIVTVKEVSSIDEGRFRRYMLRRLAAVNPRWRVVAPSPDSPVRLLFVTARRGA